MQNYFDNEATSSTLHATMKPARGGKCLVTLSTYEDRKEALLNTTIMDDAGTYRSKVTKNINTAQSRQKTDLMDSRELKQEAQSHIPKPPPLQMTTNNNTYKNNNTNSSNNNTQTNSNASSSNKSFTINEQLTSTLQNSNLNNYPSNNDSYSRSNKQSTVTSNTLNNNRQTLRLGSVTIGEYRQQSSRREPEKFDFISTQKRTRGDSGDTTPTNEALQSELQNTLTRANLRKSNSSSYTEHQRNCPLHQQQLQQHQSQDYGNNGLTMAEVSKKLQKSSLNDKQANEIATKTNNRLANHSNGTTGVGTSILKNGNRNGNGSSSHNKAVEKSIKFG